MPKEFIKIDQRGYKFIREATIKSLDDALVELITNSDDAYDKGKIIQKKIEIELDYKLKTLKVRDFAIGLFAEEMKKCFLQAGKFTSDKASRGFFSRGAKDITALGDVTFESVKKRKFSRVILDKDARGMLEVADSKATRKIRKKNLGIPNGNGLLVSINIKDSFELPTPHYLCNIFIHHISLRNILSNIDNNITLKVLNYKDEKYNKIHQLKYENPNGELLMYFTYKIKYYPDAEAFFALYESKDKLYNNGNKKYNDWGILISSQKVIHDNTTFNSKNTFNPNMKKLFGIIHCDYLNQLLHDYDKNGFALEASKGFGEKDIVDVGGTVKELEMFQNLAVANAVVLGGNSAESRDEEFKLNNISKRKISDYFNKKEIPKKKLSKSERTGVNFREEMENETGLEKGLTKSYVSFQNIFIGIQKT